MLTSSIKHISQSVGETLNLRISVAILLVTFAIHRWYQNRQIAKKIAQERGCKPCQSILPYKWPLGLDILKKQYDAIPSQKVLAFQSQFLDDAKATVEVRLFGGVGYLTTDPKNIDALLDSQFKEFHLGSRKEGLYPMLGEGIFTQDGHAWSHSRDILRRQFVRMQYRNLTVFDDHVDKLISRLRALSLQGVVDLQPEFFRFTLATTTALIFGEPVGSLDQDDEDTFGKCFDYASFVSAIRLRLADLCWIYKPKKFRQACDTVKRYADHFVQQALKQKEEGTTASQKGKYDFILDLFEELQDAQLVRDQLVHVLIAGRDTTACLMSWTMFNLVRHPRILKKLQQEVDSVAGDEEKIGRAMISKMPYLKCVLNETLRLYPQLPVNVRMALHTTTLPRGGGPTGEDPLLLPAGTGVAYSVYHMHRRESLYGPDASEYRPERWESGELDGIGYGFLAFHGGPRICLGKDFALMEASYAIVRVLQTFPKIRLPADIIPEKTGEEKQSLTIVVSSAEGCKVQLE